MDAWTVVFRNIYTGFLLRDFFGKIVPGTVFLVSVLCLFRSPRDVFAELKKDMPVFALLIFAGFAWTVTLGTQSLAEGLGIWSYFPTGQASNTVAAPQQSFLGNLFAPGADPNYDRSMVEVDQFQRKATEDEKQQYERMVVIKEACGNLFMAALLSFPIWVMRQLLQNAALRHVIQRWRFTTVAPKLMLGIYALLIMVGLHRMHLQHVYRQLKWAQDVTAIHANEPENKQTSVQLDVEQK
jgi:hypothetical protein